MNDGNELKQCIITFIERITSCLQNNKRIYDEILNVEYSKIETLFRRRGYSLSELNRQKKQYDELILNIPKIQTFNTEILENIKKNDLSIQYLTLLNSELQSMSQYFNTEGRINYIYSNFAQLDNPGIDYQVENTLYSILGQVFSENANF